MSTHRDEGVKTRSSADNLQSDPNMAKSASAVRLDQPASYHIQVLERASAILDEVIYSDEPLTMKALGKSLRLHPSTLYRIVRALAELNFLDYDEHGRVVPGIKFLVMGQRVSRLRSLSNKVGSILQELADVSREVVNLAVIKRSEVFYLDKFETKQLEANLTVRMGQTAPLYCSALGKVFLAALTEFERRWYYEAHPLVSKTSHTITSTTLLEREIRKVHAQDWAEDNEEMVIGITCLAVPIVVKGEVIAALSVSMPTSHATPERREELRSTLAKARERSQEVLQITS